MFRRVSGFKKVMALAVFGAFSSMASAAVLVGDNIAGNDCAGVFGANFNECRVPQQYDANQTPIIVKFDFTEGGTVSATTINPLFPTIDGTEFSFDFGAGGTTGDGTWTYTPGAGDPAINFYVAKGGPNFNLFRNDGDPNTDTWVTPATPGGPLAGLSHLSFYDTESGPGPGKVPEPTTMLLLGAGLLAVGISRRRKRD